MRSSLLLLLLITTPCYDLSTSTVDSIDGETSGQVDRNAPSKLTQEELNGLSKEGLKLKITEVKNDLENKKGEKTKIERELGQAKSDRESAYQNYAKADGERNRTSLEKSEKENSTIKALTEDVVQKLKEISGLKFDLSEAKKKVELPLGVTDETQYLQNLTTSANLSLVSERIRFLGYKIDELKRNKTQADVEMGKKEYYLTTNRGSLRQQNCSSQRINGVNEDYQCDSLRTRVANAEESYANASYALTTALNSLNEALIEQSGYKYLEVFHSITLATKALHEAQDRQRKALGARETAAGVANDDLTIARGKLTKMDGELKKKEREFKKIEKEVDKVGKQLQTYEAEYAKRQETSTVISTTPSSSSAMIGGLSGGIMVLLAIGGIVAFLLIRKHRKKVIIERKIIIRTRDKKIIQEEYGPEDARIFDKFGFPAIDARDFKYKTIVLTDVYDGDMPHDKANEVVTNLPKQYIFRKDQLEFYFYGLSRDQPIVTGKKLYDIEKIRRKGFFNVFDGVDMDENIDKLMKNWAKEEEQVDEKGVRKTEAERLLMQRDKKRYISQETPQKFADFVMNHKTKKVSASMPLDPALVRKEFLEYLHAMASKPYDDDAVAHEQKFPFEYWHLYWIVVNARQVMKEHHTTSLHKFNGSVVIVGDLNGQFPDLLRMFAQRATPTTPGWLTRNYLFLGNYTSRESYSVEVLLFLLLLKILYPKHIILQRGHQEMMDIKGGFEKVLSAGLNPLRKLSDEKRVESAFNMIYDLFGHFPMATLINSNIYCVHGGISELLLEENGKKTLDDYFREVPWPIFTETAPPLVYDSVWNDPEMEIEGFVTPEKNKNQYARQFGLAEYRSFKKKFGISLMFRGHQMALNGFAFPLDGTLVTTYSAPSSDINFNRGATFEIHLNGHISTTVCGRDHEVNTWNEAFQVFKESHPKNEGMRDKYVPGHTTRTEMSTQENIVREPKKRTELSEVPTQTVGVVHISSRAKPAHPTYTSELIEKMRKGRENKPSLPCQPKL